jgi:uncharacterized protein with NRDE domain
MCTVSFVASNDKIIITSNRDEQIIRPNAVSPKRYSNNGCNLIYPKDVKAGGTWFVVSESGNILVLLNGANIKHIVQPPYRKSRGLIVLDIISSSSPKDFWNEIDLDNIEPFTLVLYQNGLLFQLRWNGSEKEIITLDTNKKHIWSSSTLYSADIHEKRAKWFYAFVDQSATISESKMFNFHSNTERQNTENGLVINRNDVLKTLSITQAVLENKKITVQYFDLISNQDFSTSFPTI